ncbi:uncharacterized protein LOC132609802 [Lycium barbarum]|uniref:uncharacterized protein LOC132609802 n=1 Tax=Lycium barbarum TaxID=112863 RepID=UPI00293EF4CC|nr:uncharacterized protein LOC132609802 [Lycium barbarum]
MEKLGGKPHRMYKSLDFSSCMDNCELTDLGYVGPRFTWCNNRRLVKRIWKRLDRVFVNYSWVQLFHTNSVRHFPRTGSDHRPLLISFHNAHRDGTKYFKFLDFWTEQPTFYQIVEDTWNTQITGKPMWILQEVIGNVYDEVNIWEAKMQDLENIDSSLHAEKAREELNKGNVQGNEGIAKAARHHFEHMFNLNHSFTDQHIFNVILECINHNDNASLNAIPDLEETKNVVFNMIPSSVVGPDGNNGNFLKKSWNIIQEDIKNMVHVLFNGKNLTKFYSHTCLVLIPKVESPSNFGDLRPISLSNFTTKIISKILSIWLNPLLDKVIFENQSGFVKGRLITENVLLAQELAQRVSQSNHGGNMIIKLDMAKASDRMSWDFLLAVMSKFGFSDS